MPNFPEKDWKVLRKLVPQWQLRYMDKKNKSYIKLLERTDLEPDEKFWKLDKRIRKDQKNIGAVVDMRRSMALQNIVEFYQEGIITEKDLEPFSDETKDWVMGYLAILSR